MKVEDLKALFTAQINKPEAVQGAPFSVKMKEANDPIFEVRADDRRLFYYKRLSTVHKPGMCIESVWLSDLQKLASLVKRFDPPMAPSTKPALYF